jgi:hypothetical protein
MFITPGWWDRTKKIPYTVRASLHLGEGEIFGEFPLARKAAYDHNSTLYYFLAILAIVTQWQMHPVSVVVTMGRQASLNTLTRTPVLIT